MRFMQRHQLLLGGAHAWLTIGRDLPGARWLAPLGVAPLVVPPIFLAMGFADLFRPGADLSVLDKALCTAANAAKQARSPGSETATLDGKMWTCPKAVSTPFVLAPSTTPGKAGGVVFLIGAYQIGPYSDGPYWIALPQSALRALLNPAYADQFDGAPVKAGDVTPKNG